MGIAFLRLCDTAFHSVDKGHLKDVVDLCSSLDRQFFSYTDSFDSKDDSTFLGLYRHGVVVELSRGKFVRLRRRWEVDETMIWPRR